MDKYQLKITHDELSIKPYFGYISKVKLSALLFVLIFGTVPFLNDLLNYNIRYILYSVGGISFFYTIYDFLFHVNVKFVFDKRSRIIYKISAPFFKKRLMGFDEMTIINRSECGAMEYAIGRKKKQFLKSYSISDTFSGTKKSTIREEEYVDKILNPILEFINT